MKTPIYAICLAALVSCQQHSEWYETLEPSGPCYEANLRDGLVEESSVETRAVFDCLNQSGNLEPLSALIATTDQTNRTGEINNLAFASVLNSTISTGLDPFSMIAAASDILRQNNNEISEILQAFVEQVYGVPFSSIDGSETSLTLENGTLAPIIRATSLAASALLDEELSALAPVRDALTSEFTLAAVHTLLGAVGGSNEALSANIGRLPELIGDLLERSQSPENDVWDGTSGDSMVDFITGFLNGSDGNGTSSIQAFNTPLNRITGDTTLGGAIEEVIAELSEENKLHSIGLQLQYLAKVDATGGTLTMGEDSALVSGLRLLSNGNQSFDCSLDLWITDIDFSFGNFSETLLRTFSEEGSAQTGVDLVSSMLDIGISESILNLLADSGLCPAFDREMVGDLNSIDRLNDPETSDLLSVSVEIISAVDQSGNSSKLSELVELMSVPERHGWNQHTSELLRDTAGTLLVETGIELVETIVTSPENIDQSNFPEGAGVLEFRDIWRAIKASTDTAYDGTSGILALEAPLVAFINSGEVSSASENLAEILTDPNSTSRSAMNWLSELVEYSPELTWLQNISDTLLTEENTRNMSLLLENEPVISTLTTGQNGEVSPLEWIADLQITGAFSSVIFLTDWLLKTMGAETTSE